MIQKAMLKLAITFLLSIVLIWIGITAINNNSITTYEQEEIVKKQAAVNVFFEQQFFNLSILNRAHAYWTEAKVNLLEKNDEWIENNLSTYLLDGNYDVDFVYITSEDQSNQYIVGIPSLDIASTSLYQNTLIDNQISKTILSISNELYIVTAFPFANDDGSEKTGMMLIARKINDKYQNNLEALIGNVDDEHFYISNQDDYPINHDDKLSEFSYTSMDETIYIYSHLSFHYTEFLSNTIRLNTIAIVLFAFLFIIIILLSIGYTFKREVDQTLAKLEAIDISTGKFKHITHSKAKELNDLIDTVNYLGNQVETNIQELIKKNLEVTELLTITTEMKDPYTQKHGERVAKIALKIGQKVHFSNLTDLEYSAKFHDIGKIFLHYDILNKPDKLTHDEYKEVKSHPENGAKLLSTIAQFDQVRLGVLYHHEHYDGHGYPKGLKGKQIPLIARILSVADVYEALTSKRPYRDAYSKEKALKIMEEGRNTFFDPIILDAFYEALSEDDQL